MTKPLVLLTDDDHAVLASYRRRLGRHFRLVTASSGQEAIDIVQAETPDAVVSDLHMPLMNGVSLLTEIRRLAPKALRILLTGQPDLDHAIDAINSGEVFRLLTKPCASETIIAAINEGLGRNRQTGLSEAAFAITAPPDPPPASTRRGQQRAIPPIMVEWLMRFGARRWSRGASVYEFDKDGQQRLRRHLGQQLFTSIEHLLGAYAEVGGGRQAVTVGWRDQRKRR